MKRERPRFFQLRGRMQGEIIDCVRLLSSKRSGGESQAALGALLLADMNFTYIGPGIDPKDIPFGEIVSAFPFEGKIYVFTKYRVYIHDSKDPDEVYTRLPVEINQQ